VFVCSCSRFFLIISSLVVFERFLSKRKQKKTSTIICWKRHWSLPPVLVTTLLASTFVSAHLALAPCQWFTKDSSCEFYLLLISLAKFLFYHAQTFSRSSTNSKISRRKSSVCGLNFWPRILILYTLLNCSIIIYQRSLNWRICIFSLGI